MTDTREDTAPAMPAYKRPRKMAREPKHEAGNHADTSVRAKRPSKTDLVLGLLQRPEGATLDQLVAAAGWLPHTTRAALTVLKRKGHAVISEKVEGTRRYRISNGTA